MTRKRIKAAAPIGTWVHSELRDRILTLGAARLATTRRTLWYLETLVLSSRYQQWLRSSPWAQGALRCTTRTELWKRTLVPRLPSVGASGLEFGVANGHATRWWASSGPDFAAWHGFDTFSGLPSDWARGGVPVMSAGVFTPDGGPGHFPDVPATLPVTCHTGLIEKTLGDLTERPETGPLLVLIGVDLKEPTDAVLRWLEVNGKPGDLVYFDEAFDPWNEGASIRESINRGLRMRALGYTGSALSIEVTGIPALRTQDQTA